MTVKEIANNELLKTLEAASALGDQDVRKQALKELCFRLVLDTQCTEAEAYAVILQVPVVRDFTVLVRLIWQMRNATKRLNALTSIVAGAGCSADIAALVLLEFDNGQKGVLADWIKRAHELAGTTPAVQINEPSVADAPPVGSLSSLGLG